MRRSRLAFLSGLLTMACVIDDSTRDEGMPRSSGVVTPPEQNALLAGNRALACDPDAVSQRVESVLATMTLEQKVAQMNGLQIAVLLKNDGNALPLSADAVERVAVVGELATIANMGDRGSSRVEPSTAVAPLDGIRERLGGDKVVAVATNTPSESELNAVAGADAAIVVVGLTYLEEGEFIPFEMAGFARGGDRASLGLPALQEDLIRTVASRAKRTIVVLEAGSAIVVRGWVDDVDALMMAWYPGMEGGTAIADVLFGVTNPSGRLPVTFPLSEAQLPVWDIVSVEAAYDYLHGYRLLDARSERPEYPFGFGLSYSETVLGRLSITPESAGAADVVTVSVDVYNTGERDIDEVVQVYGSAPDSAVMRAPRVLVGFARVALEPGQVKTVRVAVPISTAFSHWDESAGAWALESTRYVLDVGTSSRDLPLRGEFVVQ